MNQSRRDDITQILADPGHEDVGRSDAADRSSVAVHGEVRRLSASSTHGERSAHALPPAASVNETSLRHADDTGMAKMRPARELSGGSLP